MEALSTKAGGEAAAIVADVTRERPAAQRRRLPAPLLRQLLWLLIIGVNVYDLLGLAGMVPTHSLHVSRPYLMATAGFYVFPPKQNQRTKRK